MFTSGISGIFALQNDNPVVMTGRVASGNAGCHSLISL